MQPSKTKTLAVSALLVGAATLGILLAGTALAADWYDYTGDLHAGNAYRVTVPEGADTLEISLAAGAAGIAKVALFDPSDVKVGYYELTGDSPIMSLVDPVAGDYVLFVYEVQDAVLKLRVLTAEESDFTLATLELARNDKLLGNFKTGAALNQQFTVQLPDEPAFATLFYKGSVSGLDATLSSTKGSVLVIENESGTAMSPGVWTSEITGERTVTPENLAAGAFVATVDAASFEGSLYLTTLSYTREIPEDVVEEVPATPVVSDKLVTLQAGKAYGVNVGDEATGFTFLVSSQSRSGSWCCYSHTPTVTIVSPEDEIVGLVAVDGYRRGAETFEFNGTGAGEYILYVQAPKGTELFMSLLGGADLVAGVREVALVEHTTSLGSVTAFLPSSGKAAFTVERPLLGIAFGLQKNLASTAVSAVFYNADGDDVASHYNLAAVGSSGKTADWWDHSHAHYDLLQAGTYQLEWHAIQMSAEPYYKWLSYDREAPLAVAAPETPTA